MSATINADKFQSHFPGSAVFKVEGRMYPVDIIYQRTMNLNYVYEAARTVYHICTTMTEGDILVFMPTVEAIEDLCAGLREAISQLDVFPLFAALDMASQRAAVVRTKRGNRKCLVATNVAETSITIDGVRFVVGEWHLPQY